MTPHGWEVFSLSPLRLFEMEVTPHCRGILAHNKGSGHFAIAAKLVLTTFESTPQLILFAHLVVTNHSLRHQLH